MNEAAVVVVGTAPLADNGGPSTSLPPLATPPTVSNSGASMSRDLTGALVNLNREDNKILSCRSTESDNNIVLLVMKCQQLAVYHLSMTINIDDRQF